MQEPQETRVQSLDQEDSLEKEPATHSSIFAGIILWTEGPGGLQFMWSQRVRHDWARMQEQIIEYIDYWLRFKGNYRKCKAPTQ